MRKITFLILFGLDWIGLDKLADICIIEDITTTLLLRENNMFKIEFTIDNQIVSRQKAWSKVAAYAIARKVSPVSYDSVSIYRQKGMEKVLVETIKS